MTALFLEVSPKIINLWKSKNSGLPFDEWLLQIVESNKQKNKS